MSSDTLHHPATREPAHADIRLGHSLAPDAATAAHEFHEQVWQPDMALVLFFCSNAYDRDQLAGELRRLFGDAPVVGCTTAGEIGPAGYRDHGISGASFATADFTVAAGRLDALDHMDTNQACNLAQDLSAALETSSAAFESDHAATFAILLIDGLSFREEQVTRAIHAVLADVPVVGGSAGDGLDFGQTWVFHDGAFHTGSAVVVLVKTPLPFHAFKTQHFVPTDTRVVVTKADADTRVVYEIDGRPATVAYAEATGRAVDELDSMRFASRPMVVQIDGTNFVRSIQKADAGGGSLTFFAAIEEGLVLRVARGVDLVNNLERALGAADDHVGGALAVIAFDCILRRLELVAAGAVAEAERAMVDHHVVGFSSYGEQFRGVHVNQTLTAIAIGGRP